MSLRESYKRHEVSKIRRISGKDNLADAFTKRLPNIALRRLISTGKLIMQVEAFINRINAVNLRHF